MCRSIAVCVKAGGLMAQGTAGDPRITTFGFTSSGMFGAIPSYYESIHTPILIILGGPSDTANADVTGDYNDLSPLGQPIMLFSKELVLAHCSRS